MSVFESISIQGIRSFDPRQPEVLNFLKPVTLILGQNGTGKTTIIECLKYATTGDLPPGSKVGGSFVHDPKIAGETEVKAKVSLEIKNLKEEPITVSRALKATQKNKQVSMQTLDSSIKRINSRGEAISISSKCADIDFEMTNSLGVSKAVLENVIFCHQEDSNWPLAEGKVVKERFDDLFASSKYVKALESIRKIKLEKDATLKLYKSEIKHFKDDLDESNKKLSDKRTFECDLDEVDLKIVNFRDKLDPIEESIRKYQNQYSEMCDFQKEKDMKVNLKSSTEARIQDLRKNIGEEIKCTTTELEKFINDADTDLINLRSEVVEEDRKRSSYENQIIKMQEESQSLMLSKGSISSKIEARNRLYEQIDKSLYEFVDEIKKPYDQFSPQLMIENIDDHISDLESSRDEEKKIFDYKLNVIQLELESKMSEKTKFEHEIEINKKNLTSKENDLLKLERKLSEIGLDSDKLNLINDKLIILNSESIESQNSFNSKSEEKELSNITENIGLIENKINETDNQISAFQEDELKYNKINSLELQRSEKSSFAKRIRSRLNESLEMIFDNSVPEKNLKRLLDKKLLELRDRSSKSHSSQLTLQSQLATLNVEFKQLRDKISENQILIEKFEENVYEICGNYQMESSLLEFRAKKAKLEDDLLTFQSTVSLYSKFHEILSKNKSDCPLCHREFKSNSEVEELIEEINEKCTNVPEKLARISDALVDNNAKVEALIKLESQADKIKNLKEFVLRDYQKELDGKKNEINEIQMSLTKLANENESFSNQEKSASCILGDVANMEKCMEEVENIDKNLIVLKKQVTHPFTEFLEIYNSLKANRKLLQSEINTKKKEFDVKRKYYDESLKKQNSLTGQINDLESEKLKIQKSINDISNSQFQKDTLTNDLAAINNQIQLSTEKLVPINSEVDIIKSNMKIMVQSKNNYESEINLKITNFSARIKFLKNAFQEYKRNKHENLDEQLENLEKKIINLNKNIQSTSSCLEERKFIIEEINQKIGNHKIRQRELQDTLQIRQYMETVRHLDKSIEELEMKFPNIDLSTIQVQAKNWDNERKIIKNEIDRLESQKTQISTKIEFISKDLSISRYSNANSNYLDMVYKLKTTELAISDLDKYYKALDKAIMSYHHAKMKEINKILKELWQNTYSGKDIDYLEICSDEDTGGTTTRKRNYNYRVVMIKSINGARLDMRGRCSAGQKVLASLLIRLALAEVFCLHCGVLALDEPTTNLDQENIENLAYALVEIIKTRSKQKNFQLVVITHDEDFVKLLGQSEFITEFYRIHSNSNGYSKIEMTALDGMS